MKPINIKFLKSNTYNIYLIIILAAIIINIVHLTANCIKIKKQRKYIPYRFMGLKFSGLNEILKDTEYICYYTDKNLDNTRTALEFAQAQFTLAPIILDLNNINHKYIIFDCSHPDISIKKITDINAIPIKANQFGIILAKNPKFL